MNPSEITKLLTAAQQKKIESLSIYPVNSGVTFGVAVTTAKTKARFTFGVDTTSEDVLKAIKSVLSEPKKAKKNETNPE